MQIAMEVGGCTGHRLPARPADPRGDPDASGRGLLRPEEVQLIASDDLWGTFLRPDIVAAGNRHHPALPELRPPG